MYRLYTSSLLLQYAVVRIHGRGLICSRSQHLSMARNGNHATKSFFEKRKNLLYHSRRRKKGSSSDETLIALMIPACFGVRSRLRSIPLLYRTTPRVLPH